MKYSENVGELFLRGYARPNLDGLSDVILYWELSKGTIYHNCMTGKRSYNKEEVLRYDTRNLFFKKTAAPIKGYHVGYNEKTDSIIVQFLTLNTTGITENTIRGWELCHSYEGYEIRRDGNAYSSYPWERGTGINPMIDVCGETLQNVDMSNAEYVVCRHTSDVMEKFFGTNGFSCSNMRGMFFFEDYGFKAFCQEMAPTVPAKKQEQLEELLAINLPEIKITNDIFRVIKSQQRCNYFGKRKDESAKQYLHIYKYRYLESFCIAQKAAGNIAVLRYFLHYIDQEKFLHIQEIKKTDIRFLETGRTYITDGETWNCRLFGEKFLYVKKSSKKHNYRSFLLPWNTEDLKGTKLQYFNRISDKSAEWTKNIKSDDDAYYNCKTMSEDFHAMLEMPLMESFLGSHLDGFIRYTSNSNYSESPKQMLEKVFGKINTKHKQLFKAIGIPAANVRWVNETILKEYKNLDKNDNGACENEWKKRYLITQGATCIAKIKEIFSSCPGYLENMNLEQFKEIAMLTIRNVKEEDVKTLSKMVALWGPKNISGYFDVYTNIVYLKDDSQNQGYYRNPIRLYRDYIDMAYDMMGGDIRIQQWKFKDVDELKDVHDETSEILNSIETIKREEEYKAKQEKLSKKWEKLLYEEDNLQIIAPTCATDIANEGIALHHCVKTYIEAVYNGRTTILFIRDKKDLDTPFYTLEIRDGRIRQCHGFCNSNPTDEIREFLKRFCDEKGIVYESGSHVLAV